MARSLFSTSDLPSPVAAPTEPVQLSSRVWLIGLLIVVAIAALGRVWNITTWSMWEDEEGSLRLAQKPYEGFQGYFPIFFVALNQQMRWTGLSVGAARVLPAVMAVISIVLTFACFRRYCTPHAALLAALLLGLNLGHVFYSQSIRYYSTALVFQLISLAWFLDGLERDRIWKLVGSMVALVLAMLTHFSAVLLTPVFFGYLLLALLRRESDAGYRWRNYLLLVGMLSVVLALFAWRILQLRNMLDGWVLPHQRDPAHTATTVVAYFGVPLIGLGLLSPWLARQLPSRILLFLLCASIIPVLELLVIAWLNVVNVAWYYGFIAMIPFALLAGASLVGLWQRGRRLVGGGLAVATIAYYVVFLGAYHLYWHGDRPRWAEAAAYLRENAQVRPREKENPPIFANVPGVVAFYLGADPRQPQTYEMVQMIPLKPVTPLKDSWYVVEVNFVTLAYQDWLEKHCTLEAKFESYTGPIDRTVRVYRCVGWSPQVAGIREPKNHPIVP